MALRPLHHVCFAAAVPLPRYAVEERSRAILLLHREAGEVALGAKR